MTAPKIRREITRDGSTIRYVHVFCVACQYWHGFGFTLDEAYSTGERHLMNVHDFTLEQATNARRQHDFKAAQHADETGKVTASVDR